MKAFLLAGSDVNRFSSMRGPDPVIRLLSCSQLIAEVSIDSQVIVSMIRSMNERLCENLIMTLYEAVIGLF